ncbi:oxidoreductase [Saccharospirillum mangrovi]|uniref:oxidoreductase n=1 Tax=Saccharospirillum mangrovi TaxID=2161747 RepID=UPI000D3C7055|nr:oxidoreductase [Saccharospirillum mangrovi]
MSSENSQPVALITGATSGMGKDIALRLLAEGYRVYGAGRRSERLQPIIEQGGIGLVMDVTDDASIVAGVDRMLHESGRLDVLVNCAGYGQYGALEDVPMALARQQMEVNLFGLARLTQLCLPTLRAQKSGIIINVSSIGGKIFTPLGGWYHASKFALEGWSDVLRNEVRGFGIKVVVIEPGGIETEWGGIATDEAKRLSGAGPYQKLVQSFEAAQSRTTKLPPTSVITELVMKAINASKPKTRYVGGYLAKPLLWLRRWLSDRNFDRLIMSSFR